MSKPEATGAQNLEEILASIRKSLVDEPTEGLSKTRNLPPTGAETHAPSAGDGLSNRLASALSSPGASLDSALAAFFAHIPGKDGPAASPPRPPQTRPPDPKPDAPKSPGLKSTAPQSLAPQSLAPQSLAPQSLAPQSLAPQSLAPATLAPVTLAPKSPELASLAAKVAAPKSSAPKSSAPKSSALDPPTLEFPAEAAAPETPAPKDPFWFLAHAGAATDNRHKDAAGLPAGPDVPAAPEITLSRPETLRPSLPPLFVPEGDCVAATPARGAHADAAPGSAAASPTTAKVQRAGATETWESARPTAHALAGAKDPRRPANGATASPPLFPAAPTPGAPFIATSPSSSSQPEPSAVPAAAEASCEAPLAQATGSQVATGMAAGAPNAALEEMIAQLLEPVLVRWLDNNLPRMIENVVRAEVARALAAGT